MTKLNVRRTNLSKKRVATSLDASFVDRDDAGDDDDVDYDDDHDDGSSVSNDDPDDAAANVAGEEPRFVYMEEIVDFCNQMVEKEYKRSSRLHVYKVNDKLY